LLKENLEGKLFVIPTDTIYGFSALAFDKKAREKLHSVKKMSLKKPVIYLISSISDIEKFDIALTDNQKKFLKKNWPGRLSVILKNSNGKKVSFRIPDKKELIKFIKKVGPIISTSLNISGKPYEKNLSNIKEYLGVDFYIDEGYLDNGESVIIEVIR